MGDIREGALAPSDNRSGGLRACLRGVSQRLYEVARRVTSSAGPKSISRMTFAGAPAAITPGGRSRVTTEFAPTTQRSPMVTPLVTTQPTPTQQFEPIRVGPLDVKPCQVTGIVRSS